MRRETILNLMLVPFLVTSASATTVTVAPSGGDYPNIAEAIAAVSDGDTILVAGGLYSGPNNTGLDFQGKSLALISRDGPGAARIWKYGTGRILNLASGEDERTLIDGFSMDSGEVTDDGGLVYCRDSSPTFADCTFGYGKALNGRGGAVFALRASPSFVGCVFKDNEGFQGAAVYADSSSLVMVDCGFRENEATGDGGGIHCFDSALWLAGSTFYFNQALERGAAVFALASEVALEDCTFDKNVAISDGGALFLSTGSSRATLSSSTFRWSQGRCGGGIYVDEPSRGSVENCTFFECSALIAGNAIYCVDGTALAVGNSIISFGYHGTAVGCGAASSASFGHCVVYGNRAGDELCGSVGDNLYIDPLFCDVYAKDFTLCANSPCLPENNMWGELVGRFGAGCGNCDSPVERTSWGAIKALYR